MRSKEVGGVLGFVPEWSNVALPTAGRKPSDFRGFSSSRQFRGSYSIKNLQVRLLTRKLLCRPWTSQSKLTETTLSVRSVD
jgi:hypothetical protein